MPAHNSSSASPSLIAAGRAATSASTEDRSGSSIPHLSVDGVSVSYPDRRVLTDISFTAREGDRLGLIGENGTGKSTLLRVIAGVQHPDEGAVSLPASVGLLEQQLPYPDHAPMRAVLDDAQSEALSTVDRLEQLAARLAAHPGDTSTSNEYSQALDHADRVGAWEAESKRGSTLSGLGLGGLADTQPIGQLSGGQRLRLALAALLLRAPHTLLLDEPSNHLDDASTAYLERVLIEWPGIVVFASHDRALLDAVATKILDLDPLPVAANELADAESTLPQASQGRAPGSVSAPDSHENTTEDPGAGFGVRLWGVGYSDARAARADEMRRWRERYAAESEQKAALEDEIEVGSREVNRKHESKSESRITRKFYADKDARVTARRARNARVRLETLERERVRRPPEPLRFRGLPSPTEPSPTAPARTLLHADRAAIDGRLAEVSLEVAEGEKLLLTGPNGSGKSTLLSMLSGEIDPDSGTVEHGARIGYLPQEVEFADASRSSANTYRDAIGPELADANPLEATGLFAVRDTQKPVGQLSVGQRRRLALATLIADAPPILLLDEPTNHLSLTLVEELESALREYPGTVVIASHDRWVRDRWTGTVLELG